MKFPPNKFLIKTIMTRNFLNSLLNLMYGDVVIHYSHIAVELKGFPHNFCNLKVRENKNQILGFAHNQFSFDFFFLFKGIRLSVW